MDRIGRLEVWSCLAHDYGLYGIVARLDRMKFRPSPLLNTDRLDEEQKTLYAENEHLAKVTSPYSRKIGA